MILISEGTGAALIAAERQRQMDVEGWTPKHDDEHNAMELSRAAESYLRATKSMVLYSAEFSKVSNTAPVCWPASWDESWWKPSEDPIRNLVKAGALIAAEIDRLQREKVRP